MVHTSSIGDYICNFFDFSYKIIYFSSLDLDYDLFEWSLHTWIETYMLRNFPNDKSKRNNDLTNVIFDEKI